MDLHVVGVQERIYIQIPVLIMLGNVVLGAGDNGSFESLGSSASLWMAHSHRQMSSDVSVHKQA